MTQPSLNHVRCLGARGLHRMAYWEWGDAANPRVVVCVHGLSRQGRDFDALAQDLASDYRVICPDVVGRGKSDWLADSSGYAVPAYVADMVTLVARLGVEQVDWVGTSMGGLIGLGIAALPGSPVRKLVLNDVGPTIEPASLQRIGSYLGQPRHWTTQQEAADALWSISQGFGPHTPEQWLALTLPQLVPHTKEGVAGFKSHYDPAIAVPFRSATPAMAAAGQVLLWQAYDSLRCPTLLLRGAESDLLSPATAQAMTQRGPRATLHEFAGVGHAPTLVQPDQRAVVRSFCWIREAMKAAPLSLPQGTAAIVHLASAEGADAVPASAADAAPAGSAPAADPEARARAFAEPLLSGQLLDTGEDAMAHASGTAAMLRSIGGGPALCAAAYLVYAGDYLQHPEDVVRKAFGASYASLVTLTRKLVQIQRAARNAQLDQAGNGRNNSQRALQTERVRKMLLAFSRDLRVVLLRLASRLQTLRWFAASRQPCPPALATETLQIFAPLANRLGIWQIKWELEDLSFRFLQPQDYQRVARLVDDTRAVREASVQAARDALLALLQAAGLSADVQGRPKHLYSIWKKMQGKSLAFARVLDTRALRVIVPDVAACYAALARVHEAWTPLDGEFDDYIARPKANGYQSLHTVVLGADGRPLEVQIRTRAMHEHAEHGVAAHWMYKEAGYGKTSTGGAAGGADAEERIAEARKAVLRELLAWERDFSEHGTADVKPGRAAEQALPPRAAGPADAEERIYVFTPQATIIDLPAGGTPVDFAYSLHTDLGHRCRGARVDGRVVPLNTPLQSGQTVEIVTLKEGGPSLDWINPELHYLASPRAKAKVRAWFNAEQQVQTIARGREAVERLLQRAGRTAMERQALAEQLGFKSADALFEVVGKDEFSLRNIENLLRPAELPAEEERIQLRPPRSDADGAGGKKGGVLVVGMDSLLTTLARCCRPAPPDAIKGFVTRGRGVAVHRRDCSNLRQMAQTAPGRVIEVAWGAQQAAGRGGGNDKPAVYPLDVVIEAADRPGLLRDISEVFAKDRINVTGAHTQSAKDRSTAWMTITVEASDVARLSAVLAQIARVPGVRHARRK